MKFPHCPYSRLLQRRCQQSRHELFWCTPILRKFKQAIWASRRPCTHTIKQLEWIFNQWPLIEQHIRLRMRHLRAFIEAGQCLGCTGKQANHIRRKSRQPQHGKGLCVVLCILYGTHTKILQRQTLCKKKSDEKNFTGNILYLRLNRERLNYKKTT